MGRGARPRLVVGHRPRPARPLAPARAPDGRTQVELRLAYGVAGVGYLRLVRRAGGGADGARPPAPVLQQLKRQVEHEQLRRRRPSGDERATRRSALVLPLAATSARNEVQQAGKGGGFEKLPRSVPPKWKVPDTTYPGNRISRPATATEPSPLPAAVKTVPPSEILKLTAQAPPPAGPASRRPSLRPPPPGPQSPSAPPSSPSR